MRVIPSCAIFLLLVKLVDNSAPHCELKKRRLNCGNSGVTRVTRQFFSDGGYVTATSINLSGNQIARVEPDAFESFIKVGKILVINLSNNKQLTQNTLRHVQLAGNTKVVLKLSRLGWKSVRNDTFHHKTSVVNLNLSGNQIEHIEPNSFAELKYLRKLFLHKNRLVIVSESMFDGLLRIKTITLFDNRFPENSRNVGKFSEQIEWEKPKINRKKKVKSNSRHSTKTPSNDHPSIGKFSGQSNQKNPANNKRNKEFRNNNFSFSTKKIPTIHVNQKISKQSPTSTYKKQLQSHSITEYFVWKYSCIATVCINFVLIVFIFLLIRKRVTKKKHLIIDGHNNEELLSNDV